MKVQFHAFGEKILLGHNPGSVAIMLLPITFQCVGFWTSTVSPCMYMYSWSRVYTIQTRKIRLAAELQTVSSRATSASVCTITMTVWETTDVVQTVELSIIECMDLTDNVSPGVRNGLSVKYGLLCVINSETSMIRYNFICSFRLCQNYSQLHVSDIILLVMKKNYFRLQLWDLLFFIYFNITSI